MKTKFKKGDLLVEVCGCRVKVMKVGRKYYTLRHIWDKDEQKYRFKRVHQDFKLVTRGEKCPHCDDLKCTQVGFAQADKL